MFICMGWAKYLLGWQEVQLMALIEQEEQNSTVVSQARQLSEGVE